MPYIHEPVLAKGGTLKADNKTVERYIIDNESVHDKSGKWIVTGKAEFNGDHFTGHKYFAVPKMATIMHGNIKKIDAIEALKIDGVKAVLTYEDMNGYWTTHIDQWGREVACVVADNWYTAIRATEKVKVEYEELEGVFDPDKAIEAWKAGKETVLSGLYEGTNIANRSNIVRGGGASEGWDQCEWKFTFEYPWTTTYAHQELEAHASLGWWIGDDAYIYTGTQDPYSTRTSVLPYFTGMPANKLHVYSRFNCGGFGGKTSDWGAVPALCASKKLGGYPVLYKNTRQSNGICQQRSFSARSTMTIGGKGDKIIAWDADIYTDQGRAANSAPVGDLTFQLQHTWNVPYASYKCWGVATNSPRRYYWRDVADPPAGYNQESCMEKTAYKLGLNPLDFRLANVNKQNYVPQEYLWTGNYPYGSFHIEDLLKYVAEWSDYKAKWHKPATKKVKDIYPDLYPNDNRWHGIALTSHFDSHGQGTFASGRGAMAKANSDGTFQVITGSARGTAGGTTVCCTVFAETVGAADEDVQLGDWSNTDTGLNPGVQASSSHTISISSAFYNCGMEMKYKILRLAMAKAPFKDIEGLTMDMLDTKNSYVYLKSDPETKLAFKSCGIGNNVAANGEAFNTSAWDKPADLEALMGKRAGGAWKDKYYNGEKYIEKGQPVLGQGESGACLEVAVDEETGEVEFLNYFLAVDTGATIFKQGALREIGAATELIHSHGYYFGDIYDEATGADISSLYTEAQFPTYLDMDFSRHHFTDYQSEDAGGTFGCHGIAEPSLTNFCLNTLAIFNAIGLQVDSHKGGFTADKVLEAITARGIGADYEALMKD